MLLQALLSTSFLAWMTNVAPTCSELTFGPVLADIEWCNRGRAWIVGMDGHVGIAACHDRDIFIALEEAVLHVSSVAEMQGVLRA